MLAAIAVGILVGVWQGFWVAYVGHPGVHRHPRRHALFRGLTLQVLDNISLSPFPPEYQKVASGFLNGLLGGNGYDAFTLLIGALAVAGYAVSGFRTRRGADQVQAAGGVLPALRRPGRRRRRRGHVLRLAAGARPRPADRADHPGRPDHRLRHDHQADSVFGRQVYAIGGNLAAATLSGVKVKVVNFWIFVNMGFLAAVAGVIYSSRSNGAQPAAGRHVRARRDRGRFIGGAAVTGGVGTVVGAMVGGLLVAVMSNGMQLHGRRPVDPVGGQGPRAAAGRRLRRLQQAPRRRVALTAPRGR